MRGFTPAPIRDIYSQNSQLVRGFSLVEILVCIVILGIIIAAIFMVSNAANMSWDAFSAMLDLQQQARQAMEGMIREVRQSRPLDITITNLGGRINFFVPTSPQSVSYYLQSNQIIREHPLGTLKVLANDINSLSFSLAAFILEIQLEARRIVRQRTLSFLLREKVRLRNE